MRPRLKIRAEHLDTQVYLFGDSKSFIGVHHASNKRHSNATAPRRGA